MFTDTLREIRAINPVSSKKYEKFLNNCGNKDNRIIAIKGTILNKLRKSGIVEFSRLEITSSKLFLQIYLSWADQ